MMLKQHISQPPPLFSSSSCLFPFPRRFQKHDQRELGKALHSRFGRKIQKTSFVAMSWYSWTWTGRVGRSTSKLKQGVETSGNDGKQNVALVIGVTGIVGNKLAELLPEPDTPGGPWKVYGVARKPTPKFFSDLKADYVQCDVLNQEETLEKISALKDVTHLFWVTWVNRGNEEANCRDNRKMIENVLDALLPNATDLRHICLQTGLKHFFGSFDTAGKVEPYQAPFVEDVPRLPVPIFYYALEDAVFEAVKKKEGLTWSVHRPPVIAGFAPGSLMNMLGTLGVYATICKKEGLPFIFPGTKFVWEQFTELGDAELIAEQEIWAATDPNAQNQGFNISNGDIFTYKQFWAWLAEKFELPVPPYSGEPTPLEQMMKGKEAVWDSIVAEHGLCPTKLEQVGNWWYVDAMLTMPMTIISSMNKSKELGFFGYRNTRKSTLYWIDKMRENKIIP